MRSGAAKFSLPVILAFLAVAIPGSPARRIRASWRPDPAHGLEQLGRLGATPSTNSTFATPSPGFTTTCSVSAGNMSSSTKAGSRSIRKIPSASRTTPSPTTAAHARNQPLSLPLRMAKASRLWRTGFIRMGLKFGIHIVRGIPAEAVVSNLPIAGSHFTAADAADTTDTCEWNKDNYGLKNNKAGQAYYDSVADLYAKWGVDFLKVDCISRPWKADGDSYDAPCARSEAAARLCSASRPAPPRLRHARRCSPQRADLAHLRRHVGSLVKPSRTPRSFPFICKEPFRAPCEWQHLRRSRPLARRRYAPDWLAWAPSRMGRAAPVAPHA